MEVDQPPLSLSLVIPLTPVHPALFGLTHGTQATTILSPPFFVGSFGKVVLPRRTPVLHIHKLEASGGGGIHQTWIPTSAHTERQQGISSMLPGKHGKEL